MGAKIKGCREKQLVQAHGRFTTIVVSTPLTSFPLVPSKNSFRFSTVHFPPWLSLYSSCEEGEEREGAHCMSTTHTHARTYARTRARACTHTHISPLQPPSSLPPPPHPVLLYRDIGEVYKHIVQFTDTGVVLHCAEPAEPQPVPGAEVGRGREGKEGEKGREVQVRGRDEKGEEERREREGRGER